MVPRFRQNLILGAALLLALPGVLGATASATASPMVVNLQRGIFSMRRYQAHPLPGALPKALIIFGSGCGGWSSFEEKICRRLQMEGYEVLGLDFALYAANDYDAATLERDYHTIVQAGLALYPKRVPVILGGWSTGAEQAVSVAGDPFPPPELTGLLLISPGSEGGYGSYALAYISLDPPASRYFLLREFAPKITGLRVAQWHAEYDPLDSRSWLKHLKAPYREFDFANAIHDYRDACPDFLAQLSESVTWILNGPTSIAKPSTGK